MHHMPCSNMLSIWDKRQKADREKGEAGVCVPSKCPPLWLGTTAGEGGQVRNKRIYGKGSSVFIFQTFSFYIGSGNSCLVMKGWGKRCARGKFGPAHALAGCPDYLREWAGCAGENKIVFKCFAKFLSNHSCKRFLSKRELYSKTRGCFAFEDCMLDQYSSYFSAHTLGSNWDYRGNEGWCWGSRVLWWGTGEQEGGTCLGWLTYYTSRQIFLMVDIETPKPKLINVKFL